MNHKICRLFSFLFRLQTSIFTLYHFNKSVFENDFSEAQQAAKRGVQTGGMIFSNTLDPLDWLAPLERHILE